MGTIGNNEPKSFEEMDEANTAPVTETVTPAPVVEKTEDTE